MQSLLIKRMQSVKMEIMAYMSFFEDSFIILQDSKN